MVGNKLKMRRYLPYRQSSSVRKLCSLPALLFLVLTLPAVAEKEWTILLYLNGDNDLWEAALDDFNELEVIGSTDDVDVVAQIDMPVRSMGIPPFSDTRRYYILMDPAGRSEEIVSMKIWPESGTRELDMGDPSTLVDFFSWGVANFPARRYVLVIWDHGNGWKDAPASDGNPLRYISLDSTSGTAIGVADGEFGGALDEIFALLGRSIDLLALDACLMGMWEVDVVVGDRAGVIVQSEETEDSSGFDYVALLEAVTADPAIDAADFCRYIVRDSIASVGSTLSCVDSSAVPVVSEAVDLLAAEVISALPARESEILSAADDTLRFGDGDYADLHHIALRLRQSAVLPDSLKEAALHLEEAISSAVIENAALGSSRSAAGISIYYPVATEPLAFDPLYATGSGAVWAQYRWDEMICSFSQIACAPDSYEPDNYRTDAKQIGPYDPSQDRSLFPLDDTDWAYATVLVGMECSFYTEGSLDIYMWLYDEAGNLIARHDDISSVNKNARIDWLPDYDGMTYVKIQHWGSQAGWGATTGRYRLHMRWGDCDPFQAPDCLDRGICVGTRRVCRSGTWVCPYPEDYMPLDTVCDGIDNDCDEKIDEDYVPYRCGIGECLVWSLCLGGQESCTPLDPVAPADTTCDGRDDDCDGQIDEEGSCPVCEPTEKPPCLQPGVCQGTEPYCTPPGLWTCPYPDSYHPSEDPFDGLDNDCDGQVDEDVSFSPRGGGISCSVALLR